MADNAPIEHLSEQELLVQIGLELTRGEERAVPFDPRELLERGKAWLSAMGKELAERVCTAEVRALLRESDTPTLIAAIADLVASCCFGVSPITVAYLLVRRGLQKFCSRHWTT